MLARVAAIFGILAHGGAEARPVEEKNLLAGTDKIDAASGYIYLASPDRFAGTFVRVPDEQDLAEYRKARSEAFGKAQRDYQRAHARWESDVNIALRAKQKPPQEPVAPTEASFSFSSIEAFTADGFGPEYVFSKTKDSFTYLEAVRPGTYIWYGPTFFDPDQGFVGLCYCMGTVRFEVRGGEITNLGNFLTSGPQFERQPTAPTPTIRHFGGMNGFTINVPSKSATVVYDLPPSLAGYKSTVPQFFASGKMNNMRGIMISRLAPIEGVLSYERDTVIDARTGKALEARPIAD